MVVKLSSPDQIKCTKSGLFHDNNATVCMFDLNKKSGKDQKSIQSSTTPDPGHHMGK